MVSVPRRLPVSWPWPCLAPLVELPLDEQLGSEAMLKREGASHGDTLPVAERPMAYQAGQSTVFRRRNQIAPAHVDQRS